MINLSFSLKGRLNRASYLKSLGIVMLILLPVFLVPAIIDFIHGFLSGGADGIDPWKDIYPQLRMSYLFIYAFASLAFIIYHFILSFKRIHDIGFTGWFTIILLIPNIDFTALWWIGPILTIALAIWPSSKGENKFEAIPGITKS